jgi:hypothetical protein
VFTFDRKYSAKIMDITSEKGGLWWEWPYKRGLHILYYKLGVVILNCTSNFDIIKGMLQKKLGNQKDVHLVMATNVLILIVPLKTGYPSYKVTLSLQ